MGLAPVFMFYGFTRLSGVVFLIDPFHTVSGPRLSPLVTGLSGPKNLLSKPFRNFSWSFLPCRAVKLPSPSIPYKK